MWEWLYDNRTWLFEGIGVVILVGIVTWAWNRVRRKQERAQPTSAHPGTGVALHKVKAQNAEISHVSAPTTGVTIDDAHFKELLSVHDVDVGQPAQAAPAADAVIATQMNHVRVGRDLTVATNIYPPADPTRPDPDALRRAYLARTFDQANLLPLAGVDRRTASSSEAQLQLAAVYTALLTQGTETPDAAPGRSRDAAHMEELLARQERGRRLSAVAQLNRHPRLVLLGDPGSGKSTFVSFVCLCLAGTRLGNEQVNLALLQAPLPADEEEPRNTEEKPHPQPWDHGALLPVRVVLRDFAARGLPAPGAVATAEHLWKFLCSELETASLSAYIPFLHKELLDSGGLLLLDGLDEVPEADQRRTQIKQTVEDFARTFNRCRILVTSRTYAYQQQEWRLPGFAETVLDPFSKGQIRTFVDNWYAHVADIRHQNPADAQGRAELLKRTIFANDRLYALAERPLLLTLMASLHAWHGGNLPERRVDLYADAVDLLLDWWENQRVVRDATGKPIVIQPSLVEKLKVDRAGILRQLARLAFEAHARQSTLTGTADIAEKDLVDALMDISRDPALKPRLLVEYLSDRAGLLVARGQKVYAFPHRTFQEYLAAYHLTGADFPDQVAELARTDPNRWREVALLAGAKAAGGAASSLWSLVDALCYVHPDGTPAVDADRWGALLAGQALAETADLGSVNERNRGKLALVRQGLLEVAGGAELPAIERALAGRLLARLGETRAAVLDPRQVEFCYVPAGPFVMGEEKAQYTHTVAYPYWMARYPVTVAQFAHFVQEGGYGVARYWPEATAAGYWKKGEYSDRREPRSYGDPFHLPNHPVVGVSWYEALAYARWLGELYAGQGWLPPGFQVQLPSEPEWEKAARGGQALAAAPLVRAIPILAGVAPAPATLPNPLPSRTYPWGDTADPERANYDATSVGSTSAVGCFAGGASRYGVEEMSGNVWEWMRSLWGKDFGYPYDAKDGREDLAAGPRELRVLRGGAFYNNVGYVRCGVRYWNDPDFESWNGGFRVVLSPCTSDR